MKRITESDSSYDNLEEMKLSEILTSINKEDQTVPLAVAKAIPAIERLVQVIVEKIQDGGRLFYIGAGTSGRSEEHTSELQSLMRISYAVFCLKKKKKQKRHIS